MTVKELKDELNKYPEDFRIEIKSYDEDFNDITVKKSGNYVRLFIRYIDEYGNYLR